MQRGLLDVQRRVLGPEHPSTIGTMINLANSFSEQGKHVEAEQMRREIHEVRRRAPAKDSANNSSASSPERFRMFLFSGVAAIALVELVQVGRPSPQLTLFALVVGLLIGLWIGSRQPHGR